MLFVKIGNQSKKVDYFILEWKFFLKKALISSINSNFMHLSCVYYDKTLMVSMGLSLGQRIQEERSNKKKKIQQSQYL